MKIQDESNDKKYFTIIPNFILNHSTAIDQALYMQMKRIAGDNGTCKAGYRYFIKQLNIGYQAYQKSLNYLLIHKWISFLGKEKNITDSGRQDVNCYKVNDIWKQNTNFYQGGAETNHLNNQGGAETKRKVVLKQSRGGAETEHKKEHKNIIKNNTGLAKNQPTRNNLKFPKNDYNEIIELYEQLTGIEHQKNEYLPLQQTIKTMFLNGRNKQEIMDCMRFINNRTEECWSQWNIQTINKQLPRFLSGKF